MQTTEYFWANGTWTEEKRTASQRREAVRAQKTCGGVSLCDPWSRRCFLCRCYFCCSVAPSVVRCSAMVPTRAIAMVPMHAAVIATDD